VSLVFQMAPGYREVYKKYIMLSKGLDLGYQVEEYGILNYKDNGFYLSLSQDSEAKMIYSNKKNRPS